MSAIRQGEEKKKAYKQLLKSKLPSFSNNIHNVYAENLRTLFKNKE